MTRRRVLVIAGHAASLINFRGPLLASLVAAGHEVHVAAPGLHRDPDLSARLEALGVRCHDVALARAGLDPVKDLRSLAALCRLMRALRPHSVLAYTIKPVVWGGIAARLTGVPRFFALITGLGYAFTGTARGKRALVQRLAQALYRIGLRRAAGVIFQNPDDAAEFRDRGLLPAGIRPVIVNGSGVDLDQFPVVPLPEGPCSFVMIARLLGDKGVREYAGAAALLRERGVNAVVHLVGAPDDNADSIAASQAEAWRADGRLQWHGQLDDVRPAIAAAHVVVLPSYREGTPRTVLEGMAMGRAIITTDVPGCRETMIPGETGLLIPARDTVALADAMAALAGDLDRVATMGTAARNYAVQKYDVRIVNETMLAAMDL